MNVYEAEVEKPKKADNAHFNYHLKQEKNQLSGFLEMPPHRLV